MQYVSLSKLPNQYPTVKNYTLFKEKTVLFSGVYPERNKINFKLPEFADIIPIRNTTFRFVLAIAADENDVNPKLFTSKPFLDDIKISYKVNNPYFPIQALTGNGSIIFLVLKEYFELIQKLEKEEVEIPVNVTKNIFLNDEETEKVFVNLVNKEDKLNEFKIELDKINEEIVYLENEIRDDLNGNNKGRRKIRRNRAKLNENDLNELKKKKDGLSIVIEQYDKEIKEVKKGNSQSSLLSEKTLIDYEEIVRFVDYMCRPAKFSVQEIENGNVIAADKIGKWEGEWIDKAKKRAAGETIENTFIDERVVSNIVEDEGPKTVVGKIIEKIEKIPVIGTVVKAVKAVVKFIGKLFSDERLKTDLVKVGELNGVNIYKFRYKFDKSKIRIGVIAQQLLNTKYADCISIDPETKYYIIDYDKLQQKIDIVGEIKKIQQNINSKNGGFSNLFKSKILSNSIETELDNVRIENLKNAELNKKIFGTINTELQSENNLLFKLKNRLSGRIKTNSDETDVTNTSSNPNKYQDLGNFILKRKGPKTKRD